MVASAVTPPVFYASVGPELSWYSLDVEGAALTKLGAILLPGDLSYAWPHPSGPYLYAASSNAGEGDVPGYLNAFRIAPGSGALSAHGAPAPMPQRATHICVDGSGHHLFAAHNRPSLVTVHRLEADGRIGPEVAPPHDLDTGIFPHQVRVMPSGQSVILVARGFDPTETRPEAPGSLKVMSLTDGVLADRQSVAPNGGYGFGVRHLDFHPTEPWLYVSVERHNQLLMFEVAPGDVLGAEPRFSKDTLSRPPRPGVAQGCGAIHVHPNGGSVYVSNRSAGEGEDNLAVFAIDRTTGEPTLIQHADTRSLHVRTFSIDPSGQLLIAASVRAYEVRDGDGPRIVPGGISIFRIAGDGRLDFVRKYDVDTGDKSMTWCGIVGQR